MKYSALALSMLISSVAYASEQSLSLTFFESTKKVSRECIKPCCWGGCPALYMGYIAKECPNPFTETYDHTDLESIMSHGMYASVYPQIEQCSEIAPPVGLFCCLAPLACYILSSMAADCITCCSKSNTGDDKRNN